MLVGVTVGVRVLVGVTVGVRVLVGVFVGVIVYMSYSVVDELALVLPVAGFKTTCSFKKDFEEVPPSINAPVPATIDRVGCNVIKLSTKYGAILTNLNPFIVTPEGTINLLLEVILLLIKSPVIAWSSPPTI